MGYYIKGFTDEDFDVRESYRDIRLFIEDGKFVKATISTGTTPYYKELDVTEIPIPHGRLIDEDLLNHRAKYWMTPLVPGSTLYHVLNDFYEHAEIPTVIEAEVE